MNSYLDARFGVEVAPGITVPVPAIGNPDLKEEALTAYEIGYIGVFDRTTLSAAVYLNYTEDMILFSQRTSAAGEPFFTYSNFPRVTDKGVELAADWTVRGGLAAFTNYSWQAEPVAPNIPDEELNVSPRHRFNAGVRFDDRQYFGNLALNYVDKAFWQDVLTAPFHGWTDAYSLVSAEVGVRSADQRLAVSVQVTNIRNKESCSFASSVLSQ